MVYNFATGWLKPLLARIKINKTSVESPVIDFIDDDDFHYGVVLEKEDIYKMSVGAFDWELEFTYSVPLNWDFKQRQSNTHRNALPVRYDSCKAL